MWKTDGATDGMNQARCSCSCERVPECLISVRTIGESVLGRGEEEPCSSERVFDSLASQPGLIFRRRPFRAQPDRAIFACSDPIHRVSRAIVWTRRTLASASRHRDRPRQTRPASGKKNCPAGNGDGVLQAPSALTKQASTASLPFVSGPCQEHRTAPARVATGSWELVVCSVLRRHLHSPARPPAENGQGLGQGMLPSLIHHRSYASPPPTNVPPSPSPRLHFPRETRTSWSRSPGPSICPGVVADSSLHPCYPTPTRTPSDTESSARSSHHHAIAAVA